MSTVVWTPTALDDVDGLVEELAEVNLEAAERAAQSIRLAGNSLRSNAKRGTMVQGAPGVRKLRVPFGRYGFVIHYAVLEDDVVILRVYHGRQNRPT
ncbi:MAG: type II toxin-antitoxin system RelE/ParE family toxin [Acaryochloris sp. RU_4_1]|nr:type II toxin-antitoxin system RelE/ParE family toxin [Acaryochloris sp. RU_4_1]